MYKKLVFLFLFLLPAVLSFGQNYRQIDRYITESMPKIGNPGLAIGVIQNGEIRYMQGYGVKQIGTKAEVTPRTLFHIASHTKLFVVVSLGMLVDEGKIHWDDPVKKHLPWLELYDPWVSHHTTIRDLLLHRTGLGSNYIPRHAGFTLKERMYYTRYIPPEVGFREQYTYCNEMYDMAGLLVETLSGMPMKEFVRERIFEPLDMVHSRTSAREVWENEIVNSNYIYVKNSGEKFGLDNVLNGQDAALGHYSNMHTDEVKPYFPVSIEHHFAASGIISCVEDLLKWQAMLLNKGEYNGQRIIEEATLEEIFTPEINQGYAFIPSEDFTPPAAALGLRQLGYKGHTVFYHGGGIPGFRSQLVWVPEEQLGIVVLANFRGYEGKNNADPYAAFLLDHFLDIEETDWVSAYINRVERPAQQKWKERLASLNTPGQKSPLSFSAEALEGIYVNQHGYDTLAVSREEGKDLLIHFKHTGTLELQHQGHNLYLFNVQDHPQPFYALLRFDVDKTGLVSEISFLESNQDFFRGNYYKSRKTGTSH